MRSMLKTLRRRMVKEYVVCIYRDNGSIERNSFTDWDLSRKWARTSTTFRDRYEIQFKKGGRFVNTTGMIVGGEHGRMPRKWLLY